MTEKADVVVIGMGPGGEEVAGRLAEAGLRVVGIENRLVGGECPYWGCIPSKMMLRAGMLLAEARRIPGMAGEASVSPDWAPVAARVRAEATDGWDDRVAVERFEGKGGTFVRGTARLTGPRTVTTGDRDFEAERAIVVATGTKPAIPPVEGLAGTPYWTNRDALETDTLPRSIVILGGGAVGVEMAQVFHRFGSEVHLAEVHDRLLAIEDPTAGEVLGRAFEREGIDVRYEVRSTSVAYDGETFTVTFQDGSTLRGERLLVATGRRTDADQLGLDAAGIEADRFVPVDGRLRTPVEGVWAIGDVTGKGPFTHVAVYQARIAAADILGEPTEEADYTALPRVIFTDPEIGVAGPTDDAAREQGVDLVTAVSAAPSSSRGWINGDGETDVIKLGADRRTGTLVNAICVGPRGGEVVGMLTLAIGEKVPVSRLRHTIYAFPTFHRGVESALAALDI
ncbi:MAG TPA: NAD(P)/FAD-dependent oxidoreductase [Actinomycetota bacterium]|nr:NAD(P)/FAD-dependent oxidoreductase [Actinomycetota bacterium]